MRPSAGAGVSSPLAITLLRSIVLDSRGRAATWMPMTLIQYFPGNAHGCIYEVYSSWDGGMVRSLLSSTFSHFVDFPRPFSKRDEGSVQTSMRGRCSRLTCTLLYFLTSIAPAVCSILLDPKTAADVFRQYVNVK